MTQDTPSEDPRAEEGSAQVSGSTRPDNENREAVANQEVAAGNEEGGESLVANAGGADDGEPRSHGEDEGGHEPADDGLEGEYPDPDEEVSLFLTEGEGRPRRRERRTFRDMGWKMMAAAGALLVLAGFIAGMLFPDSGEPGALVVAETATTTTAPPPTTTAPPPPTTRVEQDSTTTSSESTSTTIAPTTTTVTLPPVEPPDLVETDEPVSDVADRLVPSVVHLELSSDNLLEQGAGSGVIFRSDGYILTAAHVVETAVDGSADLTVRLTNGDRLPGAVVGSDPDSDVAVVKVDRSGLTPAELALDEPPRVGQMVVAVGSPWGLVSSVTSGVVSATDRIVDGRLLIQSDAVLYPGNSGGALADRYGRLVGINVSIFTDSTSLESVEFQGVGFAVPVDLAYRIAQALIAGEPVHTAFLGVSGRDTDGDAGVEIMEVFPGSGAEAAGLMVGDVVVAVDGGRVTGIADLAARIRHLEPGNVLVLDIIRDGEEITLNATLLSRRDVLGDDPEDGEPGEEEPSDQEEDGP